MWINWLSSIQGKNYGTCAPPPPPLLTPADLTPDPNLPASHVVTRLAMAMMRSRRTAACPTKHGSVPKSLWRDQVWAQSAPQMTGEGKALAGRKTCRHHSLLARNATARFQRSPLAKDWQKRGDWRCCGARKWKDFYDSIIAGGFCLGGYNNSWQSLFVWRGGLAASMAPKVSPLL